jgi:hypothetical protein
VLTVRATTHVKQIYGDVSVGGERVIVKGLISFHLYFLLLVRNNECINKERL